MYSLKLAKGAPQAIGNNSDRYNLLNVSTGEAVASNLRPDEIFFEDEGLVVRRRTTGAPMPENGHLDPAMPNAEEGTDSGLVSASGKKAASTGPVEVPTVVPLLRVRWT